MRASTPTVRSSSSSSSPQKVVGASELVAHLFQDLPPDIQVVSIPYEGPIPPTAAAVQFLVIFPNEQELARLSALIPNLKQLQVMQTFTAGVNSATPYLRPGLILCGAKGTHDVSVAEWVIAAILSGYRQFPALYLKQLEGKWEDCDRALEQRQIPAVGRLQTLQGANVLIIGHGSIGRAVEARLAPFGVSLTAVARRPRPGVHGLQELDTLLPQADIVILLLPLMPATHRLVDATFIDKMKTGAFLINAGRGALVNTEHLEAALRAGRIRAHLDVTDPEPLPSGHSLWTAPNLIITPHTAGAVEDWVLNVVPFVSSQILRWAHGEQLMNIVEDGY